MPSIPSDSAFVCAPHDMIIGSMRLPKTSLTRAGQEAAARLVLHCRWSERWIGLPVPDLSKFVDTQLQVRRLTGVYADSQLMITRNDRCIWIGFGELQGLGLVEFTHPTPDITVIVPKPALINALAQYVGRGGVPEVFVTPEPPPLATA